MPNFAEKVATVPGRQSTKRSARVCKQLALVCAVGTAAKLCTKVASSMLTGVSTWVPLGDHRKSLASSTSTATAVIVVRACPRSRIASATCLAMGASAAWHLSPCRSM